MGIGQSSRLSQKWTKSKTNKDDLRIEIIENLFLLGINIIIE